MHRPDPGSAVALVNSQNRRTGEDVLVDAMGCQRFLTHHLLQVAEHSVPIPVSGPVPVPVPVPPPTPEDVLNLRRARARVREVFTLAAGGHHQAAVGAINVLLALHASRPHLAGNPPQLNLSTHQANPLTRLLSQAVVGLAWAIDQRGITSLGLCAALGCQQCFIDTSPRGDRRYCSTQCANRTDTARHRAKLQHS